MSFVQSLHRQSYCKKRKLILQSFSLLTYVKHKEQYRNHTFRICEKKICSCNYNLKLQVNVENLLNNVSFELHEQVRKISLIKEKIT